MSTHFVKMTSPSSTDWYGKNSLVPNSALSPVAILTGVWCVWNYESDLSAPDILGRSRGHTPEMPIRVPANPTVFTACPTLTVTAFSLSSSSSVIRN